MSSEGANAFIARWAAAGASERANSQPFLCELCDVLELARPEPTREASYALEYDLTEHRPDGFHRYRVAGPSRCGVSCCHTGKIRLIGKCQYRGHLHAGKLNLGIVLAEATGWEKYPGGSPSECCGAYSP
jgi:hypothetical protein